MSIDIITTGGTIDKAYFEHDGSLGFGDSYIESLLKLGRVTGDYQLHPLMAVDSLEMTSEQRKQIVAHCLNSDLDKILITHGTDTMVETATQIAEQVSDKTVVITGAMRPWQTRDSDALFNVGYALACLNMSAGVYVAMNGQCFNYNDVKKDRAAGQFINI